MWKTIPAPFAPSAQDVELIRRNCPIDLMADEAAPRILILGVTPALINARWPASSEIHAVDYDPVMIEALWQEREGASCHCARWQDLPFADNFFDLIVGDCSFNALPAIPEYEGVLKEIARVGKPSCTMISRFFMQSKPRLSLSILISEATGRFAGFGASARRLLIPIAASGLDGSLSSKDIRGRIVDECGDVDEFLAALQQEGEDKERALRTFAFDQRLNYPNKQQVEDTFGRYFDVITFSFPEYDCGQFCPTIGLTGVKAKHST
jgi:SAM-dependent methyltransferase